MIKKTVNNKAKTGLWPTSYIYNIDYHYLQKNCSTHTTTTKI